jgi:adenylate cyclase
VSESRVEHRFAVIFCADVVGYSRLTGIDEEGTLAAVRNIRNALVDPQIAAHRGRIVRTMGDGLLVEFNSVVDAVRCAVAIQRAMPEHSVDMPADRRICYRIAINMGDVVSDGDLIYGDGVMIASQMESLADPGGINVSRAVRDQVRDRLPIGFEDTGEQEIKNIARPVRVFRIVLDERPAATVGRRTPPPAHERPALAVLPFQNLGDMYRSSIALYPQLSST